MWEEAGLQGLPWTVPSSPLLLQPAGGGPLGFVLCAGSARAPLLPWSPQRGQGGPSHPSSLCTQVHLHQGPPRAPGQDRPGQVPAQHALPTGAPGTRCPGGRGQASAGGAGPWPPHPHPHPPPAAVTMLRGGCGVHSWPLTSSLWAASPSGPHPLQRQIKRCLREGML